MWPLLKTGRKSETKRKSQIESESPRRLFTFVVVVIVQPADAGDRQGALCVVMLRRKSIGSYSNLYLHIGNMFSFFLEGPGVDLIM